MSRRSELRRRPAGVDSTRDPPPPPSTIPVTGQPSDGYAIFLAVAADLWAYKEAFRQELGLKDVKPWSDFFVHFKPPRAWNLTVIDERVTTNYLHYRGNYSIIAGAFMVLGIVLNIKVLLALVGCAFLLAFLFPAPESARVVALGERPLAWSEKMAAAVLGVACILGLSGTWMVLLFYAGTGIFLCTLHAIFRPRTLRSKANRVAEDVKASGGFTIEGAQTFVERAFNITPSASQ